MSAEATAWVWKHSPYNGAKFVCHLAIADVCNTDYENEFWMGSERLAAKVRMTGGNVRKRLREMAKDGALEIISEGGGAMATRYRLLMDSEEFPPVYDWSRRFDAGSRPGNATPRVDRTRESRYQDARTKRELNSQPQLINTFDDFWQRYPRKVARNAAQKIWDRMPGVDQDRALVAVIHFRDCFDQALSLGADKDDVKQFTPHPATWLNQGRFEDDPEEVTSKYLSHVKDRYGSGLVDYLSTTDAGPSFWEGSDEQATDTSDDRSLSAGFQ